MSAARVEAVSAPRVSVHAAQAPPCAMVVFGASGDLTQRKLVPALYNLAAGGALPDRFAFLGVARPAMTSEEFREKMREAVGRFSRRALDPEVWREFAPRLEYIQGEFDDTRVIERVRTRVEQLDAGEGLEGNLFYLATPPTEFAKVLQRLADNRLITPPGHEPWTRVIIEKPFGRDLESARALNQLVAGLLDETQVFRIDHYLGKETVQNILVFRFANSMFEPVWNRKYVSHVEICAAETIGVGRRGAFYDQTGVLRDIVQNHLLALLALVAMEPPTTSGAEDVRGEKLKVLHALRDPRADSIARGLVLGQYRGYREEPGVGPDSSAPTFAALRVHVDNWRWQGVPFYLRAGKRLAKQVTEISVHMQPIPLCLFGREDICQDIAPNVLGIRIQPDEGIELEFASKIPGEELRVGTVKMDMRYVDTFGGEPPEAYERLLLDAMRGDLTLFSRRDWVEASWAWLDPILRAAEADPKAVTPYEPGSWGPSACEEWMARDSKAWRGL